MASFVLGNSEGFSNLRDDNSTFNPVQCMLTRGHNFFALLSYPRLDIRCSPRVIFTGERNKRRGVSRCDRGQLGR